MDDKLLQSPPINSAAENCGGVWELLAPRRWRPKLACSQETSVLLLMPTPTIPLSRISL